MERRLWLPEVSIPSFRKILPSLASSDKLELPIGLWSQCASPRKFKDVKEVESSADRGTAWLISRWSNYLKNGRGKKPWTKAEERNLFDLNRVMGNKWKEIAK